MVTARKKNKGKTSKFVDAGSNNWNERERNYERGRNRHGGMEKENKTLGTEICENIDTLCINIFYIIIVL